MSPATSATVTTHADVASFKRLFDKSSQVDKKLKTALRKNIRQAAGVAAAAVKSEIGGGGTLRSGIAAGIQVKVMTGARAGVTIVASSGSMAEGKSSLVRAWESKKGWRHPVFGNTDKWVVQMGHPYFRKPIFDRKDMIRKAVEDAMSEAVASLKG